MSIASIHQSPSIPCYHSVNFEEKELSDALEALDVATLKDLVSKGANPNQKIRLTYENFLKIASSYNEMKEAVHFTLQMVASSIDEDSEIPVYQNRLKEYFANGNSLSDACVTSFSTIIKELLPVFFLKEDMEAVIGDLEKEISLFEFAVAIKDFDLLRTLMEAKVDTKIAESEMLDFFDPIFFSTNSARIIDYMLDQGHTMEDLLGPDNNFKEVIAEAVEFENQALLAFLENHSIDTSVDTEDTSLSLILSETCEFSFRTDTEDSIETEDSVDIEESSMNEDLAVKV